MKNSSRLLAEIERNRTRSSSGCLGLQASSRTRRLNASQLSSRLKYRASGCGVTSGGAAWPGTSVTLLISSLRRAFVLELESTSCRQTETEACYRLVTKKGMRPQSAGVD